MTTEEMTTEEMKARAEELKALPPQERIRPENLLRCIGAYAAYDARCQKSLEASAIAGLLRAAREALGGDVSNGAYLAALADAAEGMEEQIYEHYRCVADLLLEAAQAWLKSEEKSDPLALCGVLKGIRLGLLDAERYMPAARKAAGGLDPEADGAERALREYGRVNA